MVKTPSWGIIPDFRPPFGPRIFCFEPLPKKTIHKSRMTTTTSLVKLEKNLRSAREPLGKCTTDTVDGSGTCGTSYSHAIIIKSLGEIVHPLDIHPVGL